MPENALPKWIFRNISAIRENTERILQVLESERTSAGPEPTQDPAAWRSSHRQETQPDLHLMSEPRVDTPSVVLVEDSPGNHRSKVDTLSNRSAAAGRTRRHSWRKAERSRKDTASAAPARWAAAQK
jgi:hypothetical protein